MDRAARSVVLAAIAGWGLAQCRANDRVSFQVELPGALKAKAQWLEIGVIQGPCPSRSQLAGGIPRSGTVTRIAFPKSDTSPPTVGDLPRASYAFAAVARAGDCGIVAAGCTEVDLTKNGGVKVTLTATQQPTAACVAAETCTEGECVPALGARDPMLGAGCSMQLVGAGPLGDPLLLGGGDVVSAPALVATETGFLVAYREYDPNAGRARLTLVALDPSGGAAIASPTTLDGQCSGQLETDSIGLGYLTGAGVAVSARPPCAGQPGGLDAFTVDARGTVGGATFNGWPGSSPALYNHALALVGATTGWVALVDQQMAELAALSGLTARGAPAAFGGPPPQTLAQVVSTDQMLALLSASPAADAGDGGSASDAAAGASMLSLFLGASFSDAGAPLAIPGAWGALAAEGRRAFVLSATPLDGSAVTWTAVDMGAQAPSASDSLPLPGQGPAAGGDISFHGDRMILAAEQPGAIAVAVYDYASTTPTALRNLLMSDDPRVPPQSTVRDGRVAVAANDSRVAVAWVTGTTLLLNDAVGGYAVYACSP